jgi:cytochrome c5
MIFTLYTALAVATLVLAAAPSIAQDMSGKDVVDAVCAGCHASGARGAPRIGDASAWKERSARGLSGLTENAVKGIRGMPPHGGSKALSDTELRRAITYMVNQSGGNWTEPVSRTKPAAERTGAQVVQAQCAKCHQAGLGGAPKIGDRDAWIPRLKHGLATTVRSAIKGHGGMPARGGLADLTDSEVREAIIYMYHPPTRR